MGKTCWDRRWEKLVVRKTLWEIEKNVLGKTLWESRCEKDVVGKTLWESLWERRCKKGVVRKMLWERCCEMDVVGKTLWGRQTISLCIFNCHIVFILHRLGASLLWCPCFSDADYAKSNNYWQFTGYRRPLASRLDELKSGKKLMWWHQSKFTMYLHDTLTGFTSTIFGIA